MRTEQIELGKVGLMRIFAVEQFEEVVFKTDSDDMMAV